MIIDMARGIEKEIEDEDLDKKMRKLQETWLKALKEMIYIQKTLQS